MNVKKYLGQAYRLDLRIQVQFEQLEHLRVLTEKVTTSCNAEKVSGTKDKSPIESAIIKVVLAESELNSSIVTMLEIKNEIKGKIHQLDNENYRILLELRYLCFNSWEDIAVKMKYSFSNMYKHHHNALKAFEKIYNGRTKNNEI